MHFMICQHIADETDFYGFCFSSTLPTTTFKHHVKLLHHLLGKKLRSSEEIYFTNALSIAFDKVNFSNVFI